MPSLTPDALQAWENRKRPMVFATTGPNGVPNAIWLHCAWLIDQDRFVIANNSMNKTLDNVKKGSKASLLFIAPEREAYQVKGTVQHHPDGPVFDMMKGLLNPNYPGKSALLLNVEEVFYGAKQVA